MAETTLQKMRASLKVNENGDVSFKSTGNDMLDVLFMSEYYTRHLNEVDSKVGEGEKWRLFSMFMRDPRFGLGRRDLGRRLMSLTRVPLNDVVKAGRYDDIFFFNEWMEFLRDEINKGNELAKKWAPRYSSKHIALARDFAKFLGLNKQNYGKYVKTKTVERSLSSKHTELIKFEQVPSLAMVKYYKRFARGNDTKERFKEYLEDVRSGKKDLKVSTTTVYDIYRNHKNIDADLLFGKIEKIAVNCIPVVDTSSSMFSNDAMGKAFAVGHYLAKCSTYAPDTVITFSSEPHLIHLGDEPVLKSERYRHYFTDLFGIPKEDDGQYIREMRSMYTGDCSNTDFAKVMDLLSTFEDLPEYLVVLTDNEFDTGAFRRREDMTRVWKENGYTTKLIWWNFNSRNATVPEMDDSGNIYISGYSPMLLKYLDAGFDGQKFLDKLLEEYKKKVSE